MCFDLTAYNVITIFVDIFEGNTFYTPNHLDFINGSKTKKSTMVDIDM